MGKVITFQQYLESMLKVSGEEAHPFQRCISAQIEEATAELHGRINRAQCLAGLLDARKSDREDRQGLTEDFIISPLPPSMTLYAPKDLVQAARDFYAQQSLSVIQHDVCKAGYEENLILRGQVDGKDKGALVQLDLGEGFRKDGNYELWVTAQFF